MDVWESSSILTSDLYDTSCFSDDYDLLPWMKVLQHLNEAYLSALKASFNEKCFMKDPKTPKAENGLTKEEFTNAISEVLGDTKYVSQSILMFNEIDKEERGIVTWTQFLDFAETQFVPPIRNTLDLSEPQIINCPHTKKETITKIISLETDQYFCYAIISKRGCIGLYDGNMNFLTSYTVLMSREDIDRTDEERRRKNRWITDAIFIVEVLMFIVTNTARSLMIYDASNLHHIPLWLILGIPNILHCLTYSFKKEQYILYAGNDRGEIMSFHFLQPNISLLRKKHNDKMTLFYWQVYSSNKKREELLEKLKLFPFDNLETGSDCIHGRFNNDCLQSDKFRTSYDFKRPFGVSRSGADAKLKLREELRNEKDFLLIKSTGRMHADSIRHIKYFHDNNTIVTCSRDAEKSLVIKFVDNRIKPYVFKMKRGVNCFYLSKRLKILATGSEDGTLRIWNLVITANPLFTFKSHKYGIIDVIIIDSQKIALSISRDGVLKLLNLKEYFCINSIKIRFPAFKEMGKTIEWGKECIFPGPKRAKLENENYPEPGFINKDLWDRTNILVSCCSHISIVKFHFLDGKNRNFDRSVLPAPPLQNSVLIPTNWKISDGNIDIKVDPVDIDNKVEEYIKTLDFILEKDFLSEGNLNNEINFKIARLENKKHKMKSIVAQGAPYLALDLPDIEEIKLTPNLPIPDTKKIRNLVDKTEKMLSEVGTRSIIFSTPSSSTRSKSSRTSIIEFD